MYHSEVSYISPRLERVHGTVSESRMIAKNRIWVSFYVEDGALYTCYVSHIYPTSWIQAAAQEDLPLQKIFVLVSHSRNARENGFQRIYWCLFMLHGTFDFGRTHLQRYWRTTWVKCHWRQGFWCLWFYPLCSVNFRSSFSHYELWDPLFCFWLRP